MFKFNLYLNTISWSHLSFIKVRWSSFQAYSMNHNRTARKFYLIVHCCISLWYFCMANTFSGTKKFLYDYSFALIPTNYFVYRLLQVWYIHIFSHFQQFLQKLHCSLSSKKILKIYFFIFFSFVFILRYEGHVTFQDIEHQSQENILHHYLHCGFL